MTPYRYTLEPYKGRNSRYRCPACNRPHSFTRYIDTETGQHIAPHAGRCDREIQCGYHYTPKQYLADTGLAGYDAAPRHLPRRQVVLPVACSYIPDDMFRHSLRPAGYEANNFAHYLLGLFGAVVSGQIMYNYFIGSSTHWHGATVFWQVDADRNVRTGKIMLYDVNTGKRVKQPYNHIAWAHTTLQNYHLQQCFFGEHLLQASRFKPVAIVESEKTAVIASAFMPRYIWLATGSLSNLTAAKAQVLHQRDVTLFPDLGCYHKWSDKAKELSAIAQWDVSPLLEEHATAQERQQGLDLADYLIKHHCGK